MTKKELEAKVINAQSAVAKREAVLAKHREQLAKLIAKGADQYDIRYKEDDIKTATGKLEDARRILKNWQDKLGAQISRDAFIEANAPQVIKDFLERWKPMPSKHARCSASAAHRWINCPGSVALSDQCPDPGASSYADEGTVAHELAELKLRHALHEITDAQYKKRLAKIQQNDYYNGEMGEATDFYVEVVLEELAAAGEGAELMIEQRLDLGQWIPEGFGTSDAVIISAVHHYIQVIDLKYGKGIKVEAKNNPQFRLYGLGAVSLFGDLYDFDTVKTTVVQPRLDHVDSEVVILKELLLWGEEEVAHRAIMAMEGTDYMAAGDWCRFCPAKTRCRKRAEFNLELARMEFQKPPLLSDEEIGEVLAKADHLQKWAEEVNQYALEQALAGKHFEGWKLVEGRSIRKYADETKVASTLMDAGFDEAMLYQRKLNGITEMEKLVGKKKLAAALGDLLIKPAGKPVLVPESDKREAINTTEAAKADFTNTDDEIPSF